MIKRLSRTLVVLAVLAAAGSMAAVAGADTIVQSFSASGSIQPGFVVAVKPGSSTVVEAAPSGQSQLIYGVAIDPSQAPATLQRAAGQQVFVATNGTYPVLVSNENGPINPGDYLSISSTAGIAAKAAGQQSFVLGQALQKFDGKSGVISAGSNGSTIGRVSVSILVIRNPNLKNNVALPSFLESVGDSVAGKEVSAIRIYAALGVFLVAAVIAFGSLTSGIRSAMIAIGRNPLSRQFILKGLVQVVVVAVVILSLGLIGVYLLLKL